MQHLEKNLEKLFCPKCLLAYEYLNIIELHECILNTYPRIIVRSVHKINRPFGQNKIKQKLLENFANKKLKTTFVLSHSEIKIRTSL